MGKYIVTIVVSACCKAGAFTLGVYSNRKSISFDCRQVKDENWSQLPDKTSKVKGSESLICCSSLGRRQSPLAAPCVGWRVQPNELLIVYSAESSHLLHVRFYPPIKTGEVIKLIEGECSYHQLCFNWTKSCSLRYYLVCLA